MVGANASWWRRHNQRNYLRRSRTMSEACKGKGRGGQNAHWEVELDIVNSCGKGQKKKVVWMGRLAKLKIDILMRKFKNQEWFAYLLGKEHRVQDIFLPEQRASTAFVGNIECKEYNKLPIIGAMHSHHNMGSTSSSHDHDFVNSNHNISLIVSHREGIQGQVRIKVPCGALFITKADVRLDLEVDFNKKEFMTEVDEKINKPKECTAATCYCGKGSNCDAASAAHDVSYGLGYVPRHKRTFPTHHQGCTCSPCQQDRRQHAKQKRWDTGGNGKDETTQEEVIDAAFEGAWICEECSKINYENEGDEKATECVWCNSPRDVVAADAELTMIDVEKEIDELEKLFDGVDEEEELTEVVEDALAKKHDDTMDKMDKESILETAMGIAAKYLVVVKQLSGSRYKLHTDNIAAQLAMDYNEKEDDIRDEIVKLVMMIEEQLSKEEIVEEEKEEEKTDK